MACKISLDEENQVTKMVRQTGCYDFHMAVENCMGEFQDWRKCQKQVSL